MKINNIVFSVFILCVSISCKDNDAVVPINQNTTNKAVAEAFTIDTFSEFPPEIDGCACTYAKGNVDLKAEKYIYISNHDKIAFLKINGVLTKFTQTAEKQINSTDFIEKYISTNYKMIILIKVGKQTADESWLNTGLIKLTDKNGKSISQVFYGECGC